MYILSSGQGCKDVRHASISILQLETQSHNAAVQCIHFVCIHRLFTHVQSMEHMLGGAKHQVQLHLLECSDFQHSPTIWRP